MGKWGWMLISIGCIAMIYSQTNEEFNAKMTALIGGLALCAIGGIMSYMDIRKNKAKK